MKNKRRLARVDVKTVLKPIPGVFETAGGVRCKGAVLDLSLDGLFFATRYLPECRDQIRVVLQLPTGTPIKVRGEVRWTTTNSAHGEPGFGLEIERPPDEYRALCQGFLAELSSLLSSD